MGTTRQARRGVTRVPSLVRRLRRAAGLDRESQAGDAGRHLFHGGTKAREAIRARNAPRL